MGMMSMCDHVHDTPLFGNSTQNVTLALLLVGYPWPSTSFSVVPWCKSIETNISSKP